MPAFGSYSVSAMATNASILLELTRRYLEPSRGYHSLAHVSDLLMRGRDLRLSDEQVMAIWFHDAVYDSKSKTNEEDSAKLAKDLLGAAGWEGPRVARVERMVLDTKSHVPSSPESALVLDLDLSPLAVEWGAFVANTEAIFFEYSWVPKEEFLAGRRAFFASMLQRPKIYHTTWGQGLEARARANLQRSIAGKHGVAG